MSKLSNKQRRTQIAAINKAIEVVGNRTKLASIISKNTKKDVGRHRIRDYLEQGMPADGAWEIYVATDRKVDLHLLDPLNYDKNKVRPV